MMLVQRWKPPNGLRFTRAALTDRDVVRAHLDTKMATILSTRSGVGCKRGLGRAHIEVDGQSRPIAPRGLAVY